MELKVESTVFYYMLAQSYFKLSLNIMIPKQKSSKIVLIIPVPGSDTSNMYCLIR